MAYAIRSECRGVVQKGMVPICENCHMPYAMMALEAGVNFVTGVNLFALHWYRIVGWFGKGFDLFS